MKGMILLVTKEQLDEYIKAYSEGKPMISDEEYDRLLEEYLRENGESNRPFLRQKQTDSVNDVVGTLTKVYGVTTPMRADQKVYLDWIRTKKISPKTKIMVQPKFDGCSVALDGVINEYFTRGSVDDGESVNVTKLFTNHWKNNIPEIGAIKFEAIMAHEVFKQLPTEYKRPRDVVSGTITSQNEEFSAFITLIPLRLYIDRKEYIPMELKELSLETTADDTEGIENFISNILSDGATVVMNELTYSCDGVVVSVINEDESTGEECAIKILNNIKETKLINIDWQFGKTGKITPVGILEPVYFDNVKVDHVGLSTLDRVIELGLKYNETVRIVYNIVPYLIDGYHDGSIPIQIPTRCPICGAELNFKTMKTVRCTNPYCKGLKIGLIHRYCEKMRMAGIAKNTLTKFFEVGIVTCIGDLYRLTPDMIMSIDGFKEKSANNIIKSIQSASTNVKLEKWLGALPIKDISAKTWKLVIDAKYPFDTMKAVNAYKENIEHGTPDSFMTECIPNYVHGFSTNTYAAMREGLVLYWAEIVDAIQYISFDILTDTRKPTRGRVTLTGTRDEKLTRYLLDKGYDVGEYSSKTIALVIPTRDYISNKVQKAKNSGIPIYTIEEAYGAL